MCFSLALAVSTVRISPHHALVLLKMRSGLLKMRFFVTTDLLYLFTLGFSPKIGGTDFVWTSYVLRWQARCSQGQCGVPRQHTTP